MGIRHSSSRLVLITALVVAVLCLLAAATAIAGAGSHQGARSSARPGKPVAKEPRGAVATTKPTFTWRKATGATTYEVRVYAGKTLVLKKTGIRKLSWTSSKTLPQNVGLSWKVRGRNARGTGAWSKSGAFTTAAPAPSANDIAYGFDGEIWTVAPDGSSKRRLTHTIGSRYYDQDPTWSPDRTRIAYKHGDAGRDGVGPEGINFVLRVVNFDGSGDRRLEYAGPPVEMSADIAWSPDGNIIAGAYRESPWASECTITVLDLRTMTSRAVATFASSGFFLDWSPDSRVLAVVSSSAAFLLDVSSGAVVRSFDFGPGAEVDSVCWRPDGQYLLFRLHEYVGDEVYQWAELRTPAGVLVETLPQIPYPPSYSPDSSQYAYCADDGPADGDDDVLWKANVDGSGVTQVLRTRPDPIYRLGFESVAWK